MRMCFSSVGKNPASVTRTVYKPGESFSPRKIPSVLVSSWRATFTPEASASSSTLAPICGVPVPSKTTPASLPGPGFEAVFNCASGNLALAGAATPANHASVMAPKWRSLRCFTLRYLQVERSLRSWFPMDA